MVIIMVYVRGRVLHFRTSSGLGKTLSGIRSSGLRQGNITISKKKTHETKRKLNQKSSEKRLCYALLLSHVDDVFGKCSSWDLTTASPAVSPEALLSETFLSDAIFFF